MLVKLLDAGQQLPVHVHPNRSFAYRHLGSRHGKTESWVVLGARGAEPVVYVGWSHDVETAELSRMGGRPGRGGDAREHAPLEVEPGDAVLVPAGTAHAIGEGIFAVELQEPTDFSIMLQLQGL